MVLFFSSVKKISCRTSNYPDWEAGGSGSGSGRPTRPSSGALTSQSALFI